MADSPIGFIVIGFLMLVLCKFVLRFHMTIIKRRVGEYNFNKNSKFWKWYECVFFVTWIALGLGIVIIHVLRFF